MPASSATRRIPKYRLHKTDGRAIVTIESKDYLFGKHGTEASREKYDRLIAEWLSRGAVGPAS